MRRAYAAVAAIVGIFLCIQLGALALVEPFQAAGYQTVEDPTDPTNSVLYIGAILVATAVMLAAFKYDADVVVRLLVIVSATFISYYVFTVLLPVVEVFGVNGLAVAAALGLAAALALYPEWYVIDGAGIVMGAGAAGLFGISFGLLPAILLLIGLAVYDAISVYGTEHMLDLASGVMDLKVPVILVVPLTLSYSFLDSEMPETKPDPDEEDDETDDANDADGATGDDAEQAPLDRDAFFIGLGDAVMPTVLVASAAFFAPASIPTLNLLGVEAALPAVTAMVGTILGLLVLMRMVMKGRAHAGLPLLNGGAIAGYLVGALAVGIPLLQAVGL
ncbi:presenilin family intramembrane aspartyl protease PSH [Halorarius litoreus]|uniref:presenilin family intramembrane aspartyl protease PSH n=1 Tax=Halorarius litoreus TaxID=2962676 RepID=UPI0020CDB98E|nr:presenilin family intramembrane aspartyl protease PSH [Halorarius litoreus]